MYQVELRGKLPSNLIGKEDILTSNVFSLFKYAERAIFLDALLKSLELAIDQSDLEDALFPFWPTYNDGTEPDLVLIVGNYYLLFEAKYFSNFGKATNTLKSQLEREMTSGLAEAQNLGKQFFLIAITQDYVYKQFEFNEILPKYNKYFKWMNWYSVTDMLVHLLESQKTNLPSYHLASDLLALLEKLKFRRFQSFSSLLKYEAIREIKRIFFNFESAIFRGQFVGFDKALSTLKTIKNPPITIFFKQDFFKNLLKLKIHSPRQIFIKEVN